MMYLNVVLLVFLLQCASSSAQCDAASSGECEGQDHILFQHASMLSLKDSKKKLQNQDKDTDEEIVADLEDAAEVQENEEKAVESIAAGGPLDLTVAARRTVICKAKPGKYLTFPGFGQWPADSVVCANECQKKPDECVGDGSLTDACACIAFHDEATQACEGKSKGSSCSFEVSHNPPDTKIQKESFQFESICTDVSGAMRCEPWTGDRCQDGRPVKKDGKWVIKYYKAGTPCVHHKTSPSELNTEEKTNYQLSFCEKYQSTKAMICKESFNPPAQ